MRPRFVFRPPVILSMLALVGCSQSQPTAPMTTDAGTLSNCVVRLSGNSSSTLMLPQCGELSSSPSEAGTDDFALGFHFATKDIASLDISIALGASPSAGSYSSEGPLAWSAAGLTAANCVYSAGSASVPVGSFRLTLGSLEIAEGGAGGAAGAGAVADTGTEAVAGNGGEAGSDAGVVGADSDADAGTEAADAGTESEPRAGSFHGTLQLTMYVEAPAATDCGIGNTENLVVDF